MYNLLFLCPYSHADNRAIAAAVGKMQPSWARNPAAHVRPDVFKLPSGAGCAHITRMARVIDPTDGRCRDKDGIGQTELRIGDDDFTDAVCEHELLYMPLRDCHGGVKGLVEDIALVGDTEGTGDGGRGHRGSPLR